MSEPTRHYPTTTDRPTTVEGGTVLAFLNEVAGGRKLLRPLRERVDAGAGSVALAAPQNQPDRRPDRRSSTRSATPP